MILSIIGSDELWLSRFDRSLNIDQTQTQQAAGQHIQIFEGEKLASTFDAEWSVDLSGEIPSARLYMQEKYLLLGTNEYDVTDEYILTNDKMHVKRVVGDLILFDQDIDSNIDIFNKILQENITLENTYNISKSTLTNININKSNKKLSATVPSNQLNNFFKTNTINTTNTTNIINPTNFTISTNSNNTVNNLENITNLKLEMSLDSKLNLSGLTLEYEIASDDVASKDTNKESENIVSSHSNSYSNNTRATTTNKVISTTTLNQTAIGYSSWQNTSTVLIVINTVLGLTIISLGCIYLYLKNLKHQPLNL